MSWNYRVIRDYEADGTPFYSLREVHYKSGTDQPNGFTEGPSGPIGEDFAEVYRDFCAMARAFVTDVLDAKTLLPTKDLQEWAIMRTLEDMGLVDPPAPESGGEGVNT